MKAAAKKNSLATPALLLFVLLFADGGRHMPVPAISNAVKAATARATFPTPGRVVPQQSQPAPVQTAPRRK